MAVTPALIIPQRFVDSNNVPLNNGKLFTYAAGTTTKQVTYTDSTQTTQNTNPIILNSRGEANVWFDTSLNYKVVLAPAYDTDPPAAAIWTVDNLPGPSITSAQISFVASGTGPSTQTVQAKLRALPSSPADYTSFTNYTNALSVGFFSQNSADIQRFERGLIGGARRSDGAFPNVTQDWLSQFQVAAGLTSGAVVAAQFASLNDGTNSTTGGVGILGAIQSKYFTSASTNAIGSSAYAINNNATLATNAWGFYGEAHKIVAAVGSAYGAEFDTRALAASISPTPNAQGDVVGLQLGSGCGLSATGQFDCSAAIQIVNNPMKWKVGINFLVNSLTSGLAINLAAQASNPHRVQWTNAGGNAAGSITSTNTGTNANQVNFTNSGLQITGADGSSVAYFNPLATGANWLVFGGSATGVAPNISAAGNDANISLQLITKGSGSIVASAPVLLQSYTVATLPAASTALKGAMAYVTDATAPTYNGALTGGGAVVIPVFCNGTAWTAH